MPPALQIPEAEALDKPIALASYCIILKQLLQAEHSFLRLFIFIPFLRRNTMKNPNGYGSVINLGKGRRRPWAARVTTGLVYDEKKDKLIQRYKYIGYADTRKEAHQILGRI